MTIKRIPWTTVEHALFIKLIGQGKTSAHVGRVLGRSQSSVRARKANFGVRKPRVTDRVINGTARITITRHEVPEWYALGWRFVGFGHSGLCEMEWRSEKPERRPQTARILEAA